MYYHVKKLKLPVDRIVSSVKSNSKVGVKSAMISVKNLNPKEKC